MKLRTYVFFLLVMPLASLCAQSADDSLFVIKDIQIAGNDVTKEYVIRREMKLHTGDTLRLEAGMMLYGNDMDETITPLEVIYGWVTNLEKEFVGSAALKKLKEEGLTRKLVGFEMRGRGIARDLTNNGDGSRP